MTLPTDLTFYLELALEVLLAFTLCYCVVLERRLATVRKGQEGLSRTIGELNMAISGAGASLRALQAAANEPAGTTTNTQTRPRRTNATPPAWKRQPPPRASRAKSPTCRCPRPRSSAACAKGLSSEAAPLSAPSAVRRDHR